MTGIFSKKGSDKFGSSTPDEDKSSFNFSLKRGVEQPPGGRQTDAVIGQKVYIKGELGGNGDVSVEGKVDGKIKLNKHLIISRGGVVKAEVSAESVTVAGKLIGNVNATKKVEILSTGHLEGDISTPNIVISEGGHFKGNIDMRPTGEHPAPAEKKEKPAEEKKEEVKQIIPPKTEEPPSPPTKKE
ncbi:MAG: polymer-forming cytoskeletal protein [Candidatus Aminicenantes bacterium]|nr:polymer-forming cytoskeletal protein [Candidatus Aminicenantes bacterium]MDH5714077.1 polymer-forming cytoskeletal protein [Candidatus Aminicenantes bacterium]